MNRRSEAGAIIAAVHDALPAGASLQARKAAIEAARPFRFRVRGWSCLMWQQERKAYLAKFGQKPRGWKTLPPTPLEAAIAESRARQ